MKSNLSYGGKKKFKLNKQEKKSLFFWVRRSGGTPGPRGPGQLSDHLVKQGVSQLNAAPWLANINLKPNICTLCSLILSFLSVMFPRDYIVCQMPLQLTAYLGKHSILLVILQTFLTSTLRGSLVQAMIFDTARRVSLELTKSEGSIVLINPWRYVSMDTRTWRCDRIKTGSKQGTNWRCDRIKTGSKQGI